MKRIATVLLFAAVCLAQTAKNKYMTPPTGDSPPKETSVTIGGKEVWIVYHAPSVKGRKIFGSADALQKPGTIWRMGADQATFLHTDADLDITIPGVANAIFQNAGQTCSAGSRLLVEKSVHDKVLDLLIQKTRSMRLGPGVDAEAPGGGRRPRSARP